MNPTFFVMQLGMTIEAVYVAFIYFSLQHISWQFSQSIAADIEKLMFRLPMMKT